MAELLRNGRERTIKANQCSTRCAPGATPRPCWNAYDKVVNDLEIRYSEVDGELRRTVPLIDLESIEAHQQTPKVTFEAAALSGSRYSPVALAEIIKRFRDRYAYAPIETSVEVAANGAAYEICLLYTSPSPRDQRGSRMPSSA